MARHSNTKNNSNTKTNTKNANNKHKFSNNRSRNHRQKPAKKRFTHKISEHFSKKDFVCQCGKCNNSFKISLGLVGGLELLRSRLSSHRISIIKGYQCQESAEAEGSFKRNFHINGVAVIIQVAGMSVKDVFLIAESVPEFMGIGLNLDDNTITVDTRKTDERILWVIEDHIQYPLTSENRPNYFHIRQTKPPNQKSK